VVSSILSLNVVQYPLFLLQKTPSLLCEVCPDPSDVSWRKAACLSSPPCVGSREVVAVCQNRRLPLWEIPRGWRDGGQRGDKTSTLTVAGFARGSSVAASRTRLLTVLTRSLCREKKSAPKIGLLTAAWTNGTSGKRRTDRQICRFFPRI
jgi:hypothetical protein